jgi:hypothetical protein
MLTLSLIIGNYSIEKIIQLLNYPLLKYKIKMTHNTNTNLITIKSENKQNFDIVIGTNSLFNNLGFIPSANKKFNGQNKYSGSKPYDLKFDKYINIYMPNINGSKPVMQYILGQQNQNKKIIFTPIISELDKIEFKFCNSQGKEFIFNQEIGLEFALQIVIKSINPIVKTIKNELNNQTEEISSDDVYTIVSSNIKQSIGNTNGSNMSEPKHKSKKNSVQFAN